MTALVTPRLTLRRARMADLVAMHRVLSDPQATTYWSRGPHSELAETEAWLRSMVDAPADESDDFVVEHQGLVIGKLGTWRIPEIGFILASDHWGRGFASEALAAFLPHIFARAEVAKLTADVDPRNRSSLALLRKHGFVETGYARNSWHTHIGPCDTVYLELRREACG